MSAIQQELADDRGPGRGWGFCAPAKLTPVVAQVEYEIEVTPPVTEVAKTPEKTTFTYAGKRDFKCGCGCFERLEKSAFEKYLSGEVVSVSCTSCHKVGEVKKV